MKTKFLLCAMCGVILLAHGTDKEPQHPLSQPGKVQEEEKK